MNKDLELRFIRTSIDNGYFQEVDYAAGTTAYYDLVSILESHSVDYRIENNQIIATEENYSVIDGTQVNREIDVTNYSLRQIKQWLGY